MVIPTILGVLLSAVLLQTAGADCPGESPTKHLVCYVDAIPDDFDPCLCTHLVINTPLDKLSPQHDVVVAASRLQSHNPSLRLVARLSEGAEVALKRRGALARTVAGVVHKLGWDGVELDLQWGKEVAAKVQLVDFVQTLSKELAQEDTKERTKRSYKIHEEIPDDVVTPRWTLRSNRTNKRKTRDVEDKPTSTTEEVEVTTDKEEEKDEEKEADKKENEDTTSRQPSEQEIEEEESEDNGKLIILHLTSQPQHLAKNFDLKRLSKYVSFYTLASDNLTDSSENGLAYHPSRLMGIEDILNVDSLIDLVTGLGAPHEKLVLTLPATALKFTLQDKEKNMAQSPVTGPPTTISRAELCKLMSEGEWTVERDEDLTAPYAFHDNTWLAFDDPTSVSIKGKYVILRDLGGAAVSAADQEDWSRKCNTSVRASVLTTLHDTFTHIARKSRAAQLVDLQEQLHSAGQFSYSGDIHLSPYRIVRVVDRAGAIHVVRKEAKTEFECSRQGYFRHPSGCNRFYRCVKFNQYSPDFTVFEYDCPAGLAFDETVEVCVWPGSLADGGACQGSSEIAPVPRQRYVCPTTPGYYADPENCRWFFACLDHHGDGSPLTAYEFRCPFGLVFDEQSLVCNWPWLVPGCGGSGVYSARFTVGDFFEGRHRPSYASVSDYHVSGGRIENVAGGVVLGSALTGIGSGAYLASGSNVLGAGSAGAYDGTSGAEGLGLGVYSGATAGSLASGSYQSNSVSGAGKTGYSGSGYLANGAGSAYSGGAGYAGAGAAGGFGSSSGYSSGGSSYSESGVDSGAYVAQVGSGNGNAGGYSAGSAYKGSGKYSASYSGATGGIGNANSIGAGTYSAGAGAYSAGEGAYSAGAGAYSAGAGAYSAGAGAYSAGAGAYSGGTGSSSTRYGASAYGGVYGGGSYYDQSGAYVEDNSGSYIHDNSGDYIHDGAGDNGGLYAGKESYGGQYSGGYVAGGAYVPGVYDNGAYKGSYSSGGQYKGSYVGGGEYSGSYDTGAYKHEGSSGGKYKGEYDSGSYSGKYDTSGYSGKYDAGSYSGKYDGGAYSGKYDTSGYSGKYDTSGYSGKYDAGSYSGKYDGGDYAGKYDSGKYDGGADSGKYEGGAYSGKYDGGAYSGKYDGGSYKGSSDSQDYSGGFYNSGGSTSYQGGYKVHSTPGVVVTGGEGHEYNSLNIAEHKPAAGLVGLDAVKVTGGDIHSGGYISSYVTPAPVPAVSVTPISPVVSSYSTVTPAPISVSTYKFSTVQPTTPRPVTYYPVPSSPVTPVPTKTLLSYSTVKPPAYVSSYEQPSYVKTVTPAPAVVSYPAPTIGVAKAPLVPLNPVSYTYKQPVVKSEYVSTGFQYKAPAVGVSYEQPSYIKPVTPVPYYQQEFVDYGYKKPIPPAYLPPLPSYSYEYKPPTSYVKPVEVKYSYPKPAVLKTPIVPLNPIQYSTPSPIGYSVAPLKPISYASPAPVAYPSYPTPAPVSYTGPKYLPPVPVEPVKPITYTTPAPAVSFGYSAPAVKYTPTVLKTPVVPLNPVQYSTPAPVHFEYSTPAPVKTYSYSTPSTPVSNTPAPVKPLKPITYTTPAPPVSYEYSTPRPQPVRPLKPITYASPAPFVEYNVPTVLKTPVVPLNPVQYTTPAPVHFEYSTPAPKPVTYVRPATYSTPAPAVSYGYSTPAPIQPVRPVVYSTPAPAVSYEYSAPVVKPVVPYVAKTPAVPLNPIQYTTPAPQYEFKYSTPAPIEPVSYVKPLKPVAPAISYYSTPAPPPVKPDVTYYSAPSPPPVKPVSYGYSAIPVQPAIYAKPLKPVTYSTPAPAVNYEYSRPTVTPTVFKTPVVPLNPIQYTTPAPIHFQYSTPAPVPVKPVTYTVPQVNYQYVPQAPVQPLKPIYSPPKYLPPAPIEPLKPLKPITYTTPAPAVSYEYSYPAVKPVVPTVLKTPVVPLNPVQYTTPAPVYFEHSTPAPLKPIVYSTPAPAVSYEYVPPAPVKPLRPIVYSTPAPPVSYEYLPPAPVQPVKPITLSSPAPFSYNYKYQPVKQVPAVLKTPVVPLNPIQYTTPAPAIVQYSTPAPTVSYVKPLKPIVYSTPAPPTVSYEYSTPASPAVSYGYKSTAYVKQVPTVLKTPVVPLNPVQYSTPAPGVNQYRFGVAYETPEIQYQPEVAYKQEYVKTKVVKEGYDYPKPSVRFEEAPKFVSTTPAPTVSYETPETTPVYKQIYNYVKTPVVNAYDKVLSAISYSTTPAPLPVQPVTQSPVSYAPVNVGPSYSRPALVKTPSIPVTPVTVVPEYQKVLNVVKASTTPSPLYVNHYASTYEPEIIPVTTPKPVVYKKKPVVVQNTYVKDYSYEENIEDIYDAVRSDFGTKLAGGYEQGYVYNQQKVEVPEIKVYTSTTPAAVPVIKETYRVRKPVKTVVKTYEQPAVAVGYESGSYEGGSSYSTTGAPVVVSSSEAVFGEQYHKETSFSGYTGVEGDSIKYEELDQAIPAVPVYTSTVKPVTRVTVPAVTVTRPEGGYYVRKQKVRVRPVVRTENYPEVYSSTYTPSTVSTTTFAPTYSYSTTPATVVKSSTTVHPDDVVDVDGEEEEVKILEGFDGQYGGVVKTGYVSSTVASIEDGEAVVGILKKGKITYDGRRTKTKVVVVSKLSDFNPLLVGKLGAECSCDGRSNTVTVRRHKQRGSNKLFTPSKDSTIPDQQYLDSYQTSTTTAAPVVVKSDESYKSYESSSYNSPVVEIKPIRKKTRVYSTTTLAPEYSEDVSEVNYVAEAGTERVKDRIECKRAGLFRHPKKCNKFYSCDWDQWKKKFTVNEFKCPIHLAYDANLGACNWPSKGPACAEDNLLV
ncbi:uncharacterized protein LOC128999367 isoform X2 [Macrosteles quadrilineatus]|uniref:uncharacterized protein LOC128999367 isoform X2 n=1 Tax=Macrosteles quadrilineatus TaxID=74068 RepID=UPI0023E2B638|nr:uncharacterized protein LOC128999367 isoform X2 [Macrosteles quadrilineatus]